MSNPRKHPQTTFRDNASSRQCLRGINNPITHHPSKSIYEISHKIVSGPFYLFLLVRRQRSNSLCPTPSLLIQTKLHMPAPRSPLPEILRVGDSVMNINLS